MDFAISLISIALTFVLGGVFLNYVMKSQRKQATETLAKQVELALTLALINNLLSEDNK